MKYVEMRVLSSGNVVGAYLPDFKDLVFDAVYGPELSVLEFSYPVAQGTSLGIAPGMYITLYVDSTATEQAYVVEKKTADELTEDGVPMSRWLARSAKVLLEDDFVWPSAYPSATPLGHSFIDSTAGTIFKTLITRSKERGFLAHLLDGSFTGSLDSGGVAWPSVMDRSYSTGTSLHAVLTEMFDQGIVDVRMRNLALELYRPAALPVHRAITSICFTAGQSLGESTVEQDATQFATDVLLEGDEGVTKSSTYPTGYTFLGRRRAKYVQSGGVADPGTLQVLADAYLQQFNHIFEERTVSVPHDDVDPFIDYKPGDWVWFDILGNKVELQIKQISVAVSEDGNIVVGVTVGDLMADSMQRLQRRIDAITGSNSGTYGPVPKVTPSTLNLAPAAPSTPAITAGVYLDGTVYRVAVTVTWTAVTTNIDGSPANDIATYEVFVRESPSTGEWQFIGRSTTTALFFSPLPTGASRTFKVECLDTAGVRSAPSGLRTVTLPVDDVPPPVPAATTNSVKLGVATIYWNGKDVGNAAMPFDFAYAALHVSTAMNFTPSASTLVARLYAAGSYVHTGATYGTPYYVKLIAYDTTGNASGASAQSTFTATPLVSTDLTTGVAGNRVTVSATAPTSPTPVAGDTWIDTSNGNLLKVYNGASWVAYQDTDIGDAAAAADAASASATTALATANGKNKVYYSSTVPGTTANVAGDIWFQYSGSTLVGQWFGTGGTSWTQTTIANDLIASGINAGKITVGTLDAARIAAGSLTVGQVGGLSTTLATKTTTFAQPNVPTALNAGDLWVDTDGNNRMYRAAVAGADQIVAGEWELVSDTSTQTTYAQDTPPTSAYEGELWVDTNDGNRLYRRKAPYGPVTRTNLCLNPSFETNVSNLTATGVTTARDAAYVISGSWSLKVTPSSASNDSYVTLTGMTLAAGATYTLSGTVSIPLALSGTLSARWGRIVVLYQLNGTGTYYEVASSAPNTTGSTRQSVTVTLPAAATGILARLYNGSDNTGARAVYWDSVLVETGSALGPYFDGSTGTNVAWAGTAHASASTYTPTWVEVSTQNVKTFVQTSPPTSLNIGDLWVDTDDGNKTYIAKLVGATAVATGQWEVLAASGSTKTFVQAGIPTSLNIGDMWVDTDDGNKTYIARAIGASTIAAGQWEVLTAQPPTKTTLQAGAPPLSTAIGDLWVNIGDSNKTYVAKSVGADQITAGEWELVTSSLTGTKTFVQASIPTATSIGDLWVDTDDSNKTYIARAVGSNTITAGKWELHVDSATYAATTSLVNTWKYTDQTTIDGGKIEADSITSIQMAAQSIKAEHLFLGDISNMATIESDPEGASYGTTVYAGGQTGVDGKMNWCSRGTGTKDIYFMFRRNMGPLPLKAGDRVRLTFEGYVTSGSATIAATVWCYGGSGNVYPGLTAVGGSPTTMTTSMQTYAFEGVMPATVNDQTTFLVGISSASFTSLDPRVRHVRAYRMGAGELIVDGSIISSMLVTGAVAADKIAAGAVTTDKLSANAVTADKVDAGAINAEHIALGTFGSNLIQDPSFEEGYTIPSEAVGKAHQWRYNYVVGGATVARFDRPKSGWKALRMHATGSGQGIQLVSGVFPVIPGRSYVVALSAAKEYNLADTVSFSARVAGGSTTALSEYPGTMATNSIVFAGEDPNVMEAVDPDWIGANLFTGSTTTDGNADGLGDLFYSYVNGSATGTRSVSASGQYISSSSLASATSQRWGVSAGMVVAAGRSYRVTVRFTGFAGSNRAMRVYVDGVDSDGVLPTLSQGSAYAPLTTSGTVTFDVSPSEYNYYRVYTWLEAQAGTIATAVSATITSLQVEEIDVVGGVTSPVVATYSDYDGEFVVPAGVNYCAVRLAMVSGAAQSVFVDDVSCIDKERGGTEITAAGFRLFDTEGKESGALVSNRPNFLQISSNGKPVASISATGGLSGRTLSIEGFDSDGDGAEDAGFEVYGEEFMRWLDRLPRGVQAWEDFGLDRGPYTVETGFGEIGFDAEPGRLYRLGIRGNTYCTSANGLVRLRVRFAAVDRPGSADSPTVSSAVMLNHLPPTQSTASWNATWSDNKLFYNEATVAKHVRLLLTLEPYTPGQSVYMTSLGTGTATLSTATDQSAGTLIWVEDVGPYRQQGGAYNLGGTTTPVAPVQSYVKTWTSTGWAMYQGSGARKTNAEDVKQGYSSYDGDAKGLWVFPNTITSTLSGLPYTAITKVRIYLYANHWYYNSGGTARLRSHAATSIPGSWGSGPASWTTLGDSTKWPKPGGRWVDITTTAVKQRLVGGTFKGIGVGPAGTTNLLYYGRFNGAGAKIEVTYRR